MFLQHQTCLCNYVTLRLTVKLNLVALTNAILIFLGLCAFC